MLNIWVFLFVASPHKALADSHIATFGLGSRCVRISVTCYGSALFLIERGLGGRVGQCNGNGRDSYAEYIALGIWEKGMVGDWLVD